MNNHEKWYVTECSTENCWCRCISTRPDSDSMEYCVVHSGVLTEEHARKIVHEHNEAPFLKRRIGKLKDGLAKERDRSSRLKKQRDRLRSDYFGMITAVGNASVLTVLDGTPQWIRRELERITVKHRELLEHEWRDAEDAER